MKLLASFISIMVSLLAACRSLFSFTAERAAVEGLQSSSPFGPDVVIEPDTIKIGRSLPWQDVVIVSVVFSGFEENTGNVDCLYLYSVKKVESRWRAAPEDTSCWPVGAGEMMQVSSGSRWGSDDPGMSHVAGLIYDERIVMIDLRWEDGEKEAVEVVNGSFFAVRAGVHDPVQFQPLDANGELVK